MVVFDFDGVFTDNRVIVNENGVESVICHRGDGIGLSLVKKYVQHVIVLSTEINPVVTKRCEKLQVECYQGIEDKLRLLKTVVNKKQVKFHEVCYVGNDINDEFFF